MRVKAKTIPEYFDALPPAHRKALQSLRRTIKAVAPKAEERISYGIPIFHLNGMLVGYGATTNHCAFYVLSGTTLAKHKALIARYSTSKGTIRFQPDAPLPVTLVKKLVKTRIAENAERKA